jgi:DNA-directed RNA polymerase
MLLPTDTMAFITIVELIRLAGTGQVSDGMKATRAAVTVGRAIEFEYQAQEIKKRNGTKLDQALAIAKMREGTDFRRASSVVKRLWAEELVNLKAEGSSVVPEWTQRQRAQIGAYLIKTLLDTATINRQKFDDDGKLIACVGFYHLRTNCNN